MQNCSSLHLCLIGWEPLDHVHNLGCETTSSLSRVWLVEAYQRFFSITLYFCKPARQTTESKKEKCGQFFQRAKQMCVWGILRARASEGVVCGSQPPLRRGPTKKWLTRIAKPNLPRKPKSWETSHIMLFANPLWCIKASPDPQCVTNLRPLSYTAFVRSSTDLTRLDVTNSPWGSAQNLEQLASATSSTCNIEWSEVGAASDDSRVGTLRGHIPVTHWGLEVLWCMKGGLADSLIKGSWVDRLPIFERHLRGKE